MAQPPLDHQLQHAVSVLLCKTTKDGHVPEESLKGPKSFKPDLGIFELLGYQRVIGETVVMIVMSEGQVVDLLPVKNGRFVYAPTDESVREELTIEELRKRAR